MPDCHMQIFPGDNVAENVKIDDPLKLIANIDKENGNVGITYRRYI